MRLLSGNQVSLMNTDLASCDFFFPFPQVQVAHQADSCFGRGTHNDGTAQNAGRTLPGVHEVTENGANVR